MELPIFGSKLLYPSLPASHVRVSRVYGPAYLTGWRIFCSEDSPRSLGSGTASRLRYRWIFLPGWISHTRGDILRRIWSCAAGRIFLFSHVQWAARLRTPCKKTKNCLQPAAEATIFVCRIFMKINVKIFCFNLAEGFYICSADKILYTVHHFHLHRS